MVKNIHMNYINLNIKHLRVINGLNQTGLGKILGFTRDNIASYERGTEPKIEFIQKIVNYFHIELNDFINTDLSLHENREISTVFVNKEYINIPRHEEDNQFKGPEVKTIPLIPIEAIAGPGTDELDYGIDLEKIEDRYFVPLFEGKGVDFLTAIRGSSMYPKYSSGDIVACRFVKERLFFQWGKVYIIDTKSQGPLIKRLFKGDTDDVIICRSENQKYPDFDVPIDDIRTISLVIGAIRLE